MGASTGLGLLRPGQTDQGLHRQAARCLALHGADQDQSRRHQHHLRGHHRRIRSRCCPGHRFGPAAHPGVHRAGGDLDGVPECDGTRLAEHARTATIDGTSIADACRCRSATSRTGSAAWTAHRGAAAGGPAGDTSTPSSRSAWDTWHWSVHRHIVGGEAQRTKMIRHLGSSLTDITYVFDEPTVGLHPHDIARMNNLLLRLRDRATPCSSSNTSPRRSASPTTSSTSDPRRHRRRNHLFRGTVGGCATVTPDRPPPWRPRRR